MPRGSVITVSAPTGGTRKSYLTYNLACYLGLYLQERGKSVCIVETNFQQNDLAKVMGAYSPTASDLVEDPTRIDREDVRSLLVHREDLGISALLAPTGRAAPVPDPATYNQVLDRLVESYDYVFVDTCNAKDYASFLTDFALPRADRLVVPVYPSLPGLLNVDSWLRHVTGDGSISPVARADVRVVLTEAWDRLSEVEIRSELSRWPFAGVAPYTGEWQRAINNNQFPAAVGDYTIDSKLATILEAVTGEEGLHPARPERSWWPLRWRRGHLST